MEGCALTQKIKKKKILLSDTHAPQVSSHHQPTQFQPLAHSSHSLCASKPSPLKALSSHVIQQTPTHTSKPYPNALSSARPTDTLLRWISRWLGVRLT